MAWFKRTEKGITTATEDKKDVPKGLWYKSPTGKIVDADDCPASVNCSHSQRKADIALADNGQNSALLGAHGWNPNSLDRHSGAHSPKGV